MTNLFNFLPIGDFRNNGWNLVGTGVNNLFNALDNDDDTKYIKCPASKADAAVTFPIDTSSVPDGAVITSITVKARVATGTGSVPPGTSPSVTIAVAALDDTSRFLQRTIFPTSATPTTFEIATFNRDALGELWDVHRLNKLCCLIKCVVGILDLIRCYKLYCEIKYRVRPTIAVTGPTGTVTTPSPTLSWTYTQSDGDPQKLVDYKIFTADQVSAVSFNAEVVEPVFKATVNGDISSVILPTSLNSGGYWVYARAVSSFGAKSLWVGRQFAVSGPTPGSPGVPDTTGTLPLGTATIGVVTDAANGLAQLSLRDTSNMLPAQAADAENSNDGTAFTTTNCAVTRDTTSAFPGGSSSWKLTSVASGDMAATSDWIEVDASLPVTARAQFKTAVSARSARCRILFYDSNFVSLGGTITGSSVTDATGTWTEATATGTTPSGVAYARVVFEVLSTGAASEVHNVDRLGFMYGTSTPWSDGGHSSRNLLSSYLSSAEGSAVGGETWTANSASSVTTASTTGTGASGATCFKMTYNGLSPSIALRAAGTAFNSVTSGNDYTLNKPAGTASGDLMLAFVTSSEDCSVTAPSGWTLVNTARVNDGTTDITMGVLKRTATGSEPASWAGTFGVNSARRTAIVVGYSGASDILADTQVASGNDTPTNITTGTLTNTDANAWRVSAFAVSDNATGGTMTANRAAPSTITPIAFVGTGSAWYTTSTGSSYTINKPSGTVSGDLMIAVFTANASVTVTPPTGWTAVRTTTNSYGITQTVMYRYAGGSEPSSWSGSTGSTASKMLTRAAAYRNTHATVPFIAENSTTVGSGSSVTTPSVTNTNSLAWRVTAFTEEGQNTSIYWSSSDTERWDNGAYTGGGLFGGAVDAIETAWYDSNGSISTGATSKVGSFTSGSYYGAMGWIGILNPLASATTPPADETARGVAAAGSSNPWLTTRVFDSNGVTALGAGSLTGIWTPGSGTDVNSMAGWYGLLLPAAPVTAGYVGATTSTTVDISLVDTDLIPDADWVTVTAAFLGSTAGTPYLTCNFYRANTLLNTLTAQGTSFGTSTWVKSRATFAIPEGTTRMSVGVAVSDRAVTDFVYWDRVSLAFGTDATYRGSTSRSEHPVWAYPQIQYADDDGTGYSDYADLPGLKANPPAFVPISGEALYIDHTPVPLTNRKYRARTVSLGLAGDTFVSGWGPDSSETRFEAENWWIKDIANPDNNLQLLVSWDTVTVNTTNTATVFQALGEDLPVVLTEGYKGDTFTLKLKPVNSSDWAELKVMLASGRTLFLQSDIDLAWWVRPVGDLGQDILPTGSRKSNPLREIKVSFVEVAPEE
jgi:hypothetical protein